MRYIAALVLMTACGGQPEVEQMAAAIPVIQYSVTAPYQISGSSPAGSDGNVYSVLPCSPLACDPWHLLFCYQSMCFTLSQPLDFIATEEPNLPLPYNGKLTATGDLQCSAGWTSLSRVTWYDGTPLNWHVSLNATCADGTFAIRGDWRRIN